MSLALRKICLAMILLAAWAAPVAEGRDPDSVRVLVPEDFAYGLPLDAAGNAPFQEVVLPLEFYQGVTRPDLLDCAVFDADRSPTIHAFRNAGQPSSARMTEWLPLFPIPAGHSENGTGAVSLHFRRAPDGTILDLQSSETSRSEDGRRAYVMDASSLNDPYSAIEFRFEPPNDSQLMQVSLYGSQDLNTWASILRSHTVGRLVHQGSFLEKTRLEFSPCRYRYLRLNMESDGSRLQLLEARAVFSRQMTEDVHQWLPMRSPFRREPQPGYYADTHGFMPVDRLKVVFPGSNVAVPVRISSRQTDRDAWQIRSETIVHRVTLDEKVVSGEEIRLSSPVTDRFWRVEPNLRPQEGSPPAELELVAGWVPHRLIFMVQGKPPYLLAIGSSAQTSTPFPVQTLLERVAPQAKGRMLVAAARPGARVVLGGDERLQPLPPPLPWKQGILWAVLLAGVALMGWMAVTLYRRLESGRKAAPEAGDVNPGPSDPGGNPGEPPSS